MVASRRAMPKGGRVLRMYSSRRAGEVRSPGGLLQHRPQAA